jgi:hypothetical protein
MTDIRPESYLYTFAGDSTKLFFTGAQSGRGPIIVGPIAPLILVLQFDIHGYLLTADIVADHSVVDQQSYDIYVDTYFRKTGAIPGPIKIHRFSSQQPSSPVAVIDVRYGCPIQITDLPFDLSIDEDETQETQLAREQWLSSGSYVFSWGNDYYVDCDGIIISS